MNTRTTVALRPMLPADAAVLAAIFRASIEALTVEDTGPPESRTRGSHPLMTRPNSPRVWPSRLTLIATMSHEPVGFASMKDNDLLEMLYVHPEAARREVARALIEALQKPSCAAAAPRASSPMQATPRGLSSPIAAMRRFAATRWSWAANGSATRRWKSASRRS